MKKLFFFFFILLPAVKGFAQRERVQLTLDKYACMAGDTVWFKGLVFAGASPSPVSTNLYVELFSASGMLLSRYLYPVFQGQSIGQVIIPDSLPSGDCYIVALTRQQLNYDSRDFFSVPVTVYNPNKARATTVHKKQVVNTEPVAAATIRGITWISAVYNGQLSSLLMLDSGNTTRRLHLVYTLPGDSVLRADITLGKWHRQQYLPLPVYTAQEHAVLLLYEDSMPAGRQVIHLDSGSPLLSLVTDTLDAGPLGYNAWTVKIADSVPFVTSVSVTDADLSAPPVTSILRLQDAYTDDFTVPAGWADTAFICYTGDVTRESGKRILDPFSQELFMAGVKDSNYVFTRLVAIDSAGRFRLDSLFFFGDMSLQFQVNRAEDRSVRDVQLHFDSFEPPLPDTDFFKAHWEDDSTPTHADTAVAALETNGNGFSSPKTLKEVVVKAAIDTRKELDDKYATGLFSEPTLYSFDLRKDNSCHTIWEYLRKNLPGFEGGPDIGQLPTFIDSPVVFYVDNEVQSLEDLDNYWYEEIAYIKAFRSFWVDDTRFMRWKSGYTGFSLGGGASGGLQIPSQRDPPVICIYTRKGADTRTAWPGLNKVTITGYTPVASWTGQDENRTTLYWQPLQQGNEFRIRFFNNGFTKHFRVVIEGFNRAGRLVHFEKVPIPYL